MIAGLKGKILSSAPGRLELDAGNGLIFLVQVPVSSFSRLKPGHDIFLHTLMKVRDEDLVIYGFLDLPEKQIFEKLLQVTGVGGKIAMACISGFSAAELAEAIEKKDVERISSVPGIGKKTAQRMILELTGKLEFGFEEAAESRQLRDELVSGLVNLGYPARPVKEAVQRVLKDNPDMRDFESLFRLLLKRWNR